MTAATQQQQRRGVLHTPTLGTHTETTPDPQNICPNCGAANSPSADICDICHTWLLEGKCKFCYAELPSKDADFCPECGKPQNGIPCPNCGNLSTFDFCSKCGKPVTQEAVTEMQAAKAQVNSEQETVEYEREVIDDKPMRKSLFSDKQMESIMQKGAEIDKANRQRIEETKRKEEKEKYKVLIEETKQNRSIRFKNHQEARRFHNAWHNAHPGAIGWLCNYTHTIHLYSEGGPNCCGDASQGGCDYFEKPVWGKNDLGTETWVSR